MVNRLIGKRFEDYSPEAFYSFVKSLIRTNPNQSKEVLGITITKSKEKTTIRLNRTDKCLTRDEISRLSVEYKISESELIALFKKRKIGIMYELNDSRIETDKTTKENAGNKTRKRKDSPLDKLQQPCDNPGVSAESSI